MATIQVRDLSDVTYEVIRVRAEKAGMSLQKYLWAELTGLAARPTKGELMDEIEKRIAGREGPGPTRDDVLKALHEGREERG